MIHKRTLKRWIKTLADLQGGRPNFSDQTPDSLQLLEKLVRLANPDVIVELGTSYGLSTRLWLQATTDIPIHCVDASFNPLRESAGVLPLDIDRLTLHERWVHQVTLEELWKGGGKVLLYVDVHGDHSHVFNAVKNLPHGSMVIFDDVWYSPEVLTPENKDDFVERVVKHQIDYTAPKQIWPLSYAEYWRGGSFYGFTEVPELMLWTKANKVKLHWENDIKVVWFTWPQDKA